MIHLRRSGVLLRPRANSTASFESSDAAIVQISAQPEEEAEQSDEAVRSI